MQTPCDEPWDEYNPETGKMETVYRCPYSSDPTSETCRCCCGEGVDE